MKKTILWMIAVIAVCCSLPAQEAKQPEKFQVQLFCPSPELMYKQGKAFPFTYYGRRDYIDIRKFDKIMIKPLVIKFFEGGNAEELKPLSDIFMTEIRRLVEVEGKRIDLKLTDTADAKTMVLEVAVVPMMDFVQFHRYLNYTGAQKYSGVNLPLGMVCMNMAAIEAVVKSGDNGELIAQMAGACGVAKDAANIDESKWADGVKSIFNTWSFNFVSTIKAELNREKDGTYISVSSKLPAPAAPAASAVPESKEPRK